MSHARSAESGTLFFGPFAEGECVSIWMELDVLTLQRLLLVDGRKEKKWSLSTYKILKGVPAAG